LQHPEVRHQIRGKTGFAFGEPEPDPALVSRNIIAEDASNAPE
jgi:hypothetical protein